MMAMMARPAPAPCSTAIRSPAWACFGTFAWLVSALASDANIDVHVQFSQSHADSLCTTRVHVRFPHNSLFAGTFAIHCLQARLHVRPFAAAEGTVDTRGAAAPLLDSDHHGEDAVLPPGCVRGHARAPGGGDKPAPEQHIQHRQEDVRVRRGW